MDGYPVQRRQRRPIIGRACHETAPFILRSGKRAALPIRDRSRLRTHQARDPARQALDSMETVTRRTWPGLARESSACPGLGFPDESAPRNDPTRLSHGARRGRDAGREPAVVRGPRRGAWGHGCCLAEAVAPRAGKHPHHAHVGTAATGPPAGSRACGLRCGLRRPGLRAARISSELSR